MPGMPAASAPLSTTWTPCCAGVVRMRLGSSGATGARSDTAGMSEELAQVLDLFQPLLGSQLQDSWDVVQHMRPHDDARLDLRGELEARGLEQPFQRVPGGARETALDPRDDGLSGPGALRELALAQAGPLACLAQPFGAGRHGRMIATLLPPATAVYRLEPPFVRRQV